MFSIFPGHCQAGHEHPELLGVTGEVKLSTPANQPTNLVLRRVREVELQCDGVGLTQHQVMSPGVQLDGHVGITAGSGLVRTVAELEVDVFFMNLKPANSHNY